MFLVSGTSKHGTRIHQVRAKKKQRHFVRLYSKQGRQRRYAIECLVDELMPAITQNETPHNLPQIETFFSYFTRSPQTIVLFTSASCLCSIIQGVSRKVWLQRTRPLTLRLHRPRLITGIGQYSFFGSIQCSVVYQHIYWLQDVESYTMESIPTPPQLEGLERSFHNFYVCTGRGAANILFPQRKQHCQWPRRYYRFLLNSINSGRTKIVNIEEHESTS